ncbi:TetR/AcrR family transcriptional regulator [Klebsiella pneumoniae]|uniref:TetR/AcrR family transcriptional regulator n=1 Tax=Klebsiella pneumoniae TaxID=573 RepID=UPI0026580AE3|nr:TetR/AcrR family transcriptional regulator [Klebsiella pneumoniae]HBW3328317.1 TetR/AcrR family transcriptional regulator [Klebsiella pneumoniae]
MRDTRLTYHHGNLRQELVDAALKMLRGEEGEELTLRAVARAAGVSRTAPYRHFRNKSALLAAVAEAGFSKLGERCDQVMPLQGGPRERLHLLGKAYVHFALDEPALYRLMFGTELGSIKNDHSDLAVGAKQVYDRMRIAVEDILSPASASHAAVEGACFGAWSLVHGLASLLIDRSVNVPEARRCALIDSVTVLFANGLR